jgi:long-chain acyl-CoA synthetase
VLAVLSADHWKILAAEKGWQPGDPALLRTKEVESAITARVGAQLKEFPGYAQVRRATVSLEPWTMDNGLLTPTLKLKRPKVMEKFIAEIDGMYAGH